MSTIADIRFMDRRTPPTIITLVLLAGVASIALNIFLASLPAMAEHFGTTYARMQYAVSGYLLITGAVQLLIGPLADRYGRRPILLGAFIIFALATVGAIYAPNFETFMLCRVIQTAVTAGVMLSRAIIRDLVESDKAASLIGYVTMGMALAPMVAPPIGGILQELFGWEANFWAQFGAAVLMVGLIYFDCGETATNRSSSFLKQFRNYPELFRSRRFWGYSATAAFSSGSFFAYLGGVPFVAASVYGLPPVQMGMYFAITPFGYMIGNGLSGYFTERVGLHRMMLMGTILTTTGMGLAVIVHYTGSSHPMSFFGFTIFIGLGNGLTLPSSNAGALSVRPSLAGTASGLSGSLMTFGGAFLAALAGSLLHEGSTALPLLFCILGTAAISIFTALYTIRIENQIADASAA